MKVQVGAVTIDTIPRLAQVLAGYYEQPPVVERSSPGEINIALQMQYEPQDGRAHFMEQGFVAGLVVGFLTGHGVEVVGRSVECI
ncbi:MAG: hypothetical protein AAB511_01510 [Patescibacteria group bacterium]